MSVANPVVETWDGSARRIRLKMGVTTFHPITDLYHEYRYQRSTNEAFRVWEPLIRAEGNVAKGAGLFTPRYLVLLLGTKIMPYDESDTLTQDGEILTDDPDTDPSIYDTSELTVPKTIFVKPVGAEVITVATGSGVTDEDKDDIIAGVWAVAERSLTDKTGFQLTAAQVADIRADLVIGSDLLPLEADINVARKLTSNRVTRSGDTIIIYEDDGATIWRQYNLADGGRVEV